MRIYRHWREVPAEGRGAVVAIGNFDGVHLGHQAVAREAIDALLKLTQSIETVGADRHAVLKYIKSRTFDTLMGKLDLRKRNAPVWWTGGQWQDGVVEGVKGYGTSGGRKSGPHEIRLVAKFQPPSGGKIPGQAVLAWPGFLLPLTFILIPTNRI